jgi:beta-glucanase (GH16 family)
MKRYNHLFLSFLVIIFTLGCQDDEASFGEVQAPSNLQVTYSVVNADEENEFGDGTGRVTFTATAENASNFRFLFGDNVVRTVSDGNVTHPYSRTGINTYTATVIASGRGGASTSTTIDVTVLSTFDDPVTRGFLTGGDSKTWYVARGEQAHLGVGPADGTTPSFFDADPNSIEQCFYDDVFTISEAPNDAISFVHDNTNQEGVGVTFVNAAFVTQLGGGGSDDQCLPLDVSGQKILNLGPSNSDLPEDLTTGTQLSITDGGFLGYFINTSTYEVLEITEDYLHVRALSGQADPLAWYFKFTTNPDGTVGDSDETSNTLETEYDNLVFSEEFDVDGAPNSELWNFEIGNGSDQGIPGWGNEELQYYTADNALVEDGILKITAKREPTNGFDFSSSRMTTLDNFSFQYGRVEVRAKLPEGGGTWPAIWMLGDNFPDVGWPETGEIDIMEHRGNEQDVIHGSLHLPGNFAGNAISETTTVEGVSNEFNTYTVEWSAERILFAVNDEVYHEYNNTSETPFNDPFFLILNIAMGGTFGGNVDPDFQESSMEIDYIRVYQ